MSSWINNSTHSRAGWQAVAMTEERSVVTLMWLNYNRADVLAKESMTRYLKSTHRKIIIVVMTHRTLLLANYYSAQDIAVDDQ